MVFTILAALVMVVVLVMAAREIYQFRRKTGVYRLRRLTLRLSMAGMLLFLLLSLVIGLQVFHLLEPVGVVNLWLVYWSCIALLCGAIFLLAMADLRSIGDEILESTNAHWADMAKTIATHQHETNEQKNE